MRDPNRIPEMLNILKKEWEECPDLRFGQLISNMFYNFSGIELDVSFFYMEDIDFLKFLKNCEKKTE